MPSFPANTTYRGAMPPLSRQQFRALKGHPEFRWQGELGDNDQSIAHHFVALAVRGTTLPDLRKVLSSGLPQPDFRCKTCAEFRIAASRGERCFNAFSPIINARSILPAGPKAPIQCNRLGQKTTPATSKPGPTLHLGDLQMRQPR